MIKTQTFVVTGADKIHCEGCESRINAALKRVAGVRHAQASHKTQAVKVQFDPAETTEAALCERLVALGYTVEVNEA